MKIECSECGKEFSFGTLGRCPGCEGILHEVVVSPVGGGDLLTGQWRGYLELKRAGLITQLPRMVGVQSLSAPPLVEAFRSGDWLSKKGFGWSLLQSPL